MTSDHIDIYQSRYMDNNFSGDPVGTVSEYVDDIFGRNYWVNEPGSVEIPQEAQDSASDVYEWWKDSDYTDYDINLLLISQGRYGHHGQSDGSSACVKTVEDKITNVPGPNEDNDFIGDQATWGYSPAKQVAACLHEIGHTFDVEFHQCGYAHNHDGLNHLTPLIVSYATNYDGTNNWCVSDEITNSSYDKARYVQGFSECTIEQGNFPHPLNKVYSNAEVRSL